MLDMPGLNVEAIPLEPTRMIAWGSGLAVGIAIYLVLALIRRLLIRRLHGEGGARAPGWREGLRDALSGTSRLFLLVLALYAGAFVAQVPAAARRVIESALVIALFLQGALWASRIAALAGSRGTPPRRPPRVRRSPMRWRSSSCSPALRSGRSP